MNVDEMFPFELLVKHMYRPAWKNGSLEIVNEWYSKFPQF